MTAQYPSPVITNTKLTVGSVCSGIEAASVAWRPLGYSFVWFSETARFPSAVLDARHSSVPNLGDMDNLPGLLEKGCIDAPDVICGGTPCQAFSLAGKKGGLDDRRGNLTLRFVDIVDSADSVRLKAEKPRTIVFWENVEGVLTDKTNAFGCLISALAGLPAVLPVSKWPSSGMLKGPVRNVAWRVLDAKFFGLPQQRRRLYVLAGGTDFRPENVLFDESDSSTGRGSVDSLSLGPGTSLQFEKDGHRFEVFREYSDCLYSAYGTKWNGNAAANNGSLFVVQDGKLRRFSPLECERLMGFPDHYTDLPGAKKTNRFQALGNSWAVPVVQWIGKRIPFGFVGKTAEPVALFPDFQSDSPPSQFYNLGTNSSWFADGHKRNTGTFPSHCRFRPVSTIISPEAPPSLYLTPVGCHGILRRSKARKLALNPRLRFYLEKTCSEMTDEEIERKSRVQKRGRLG